MSAYDKLYYNRVELAYDGSQIRLAPNFRCPVCGGRPEALLERTWNVNVNRELDVNQLITYTMPCCGTTIRLYLAIHKAKGSMTVQCCLQKSMEEGAGGIPADWWVTP